MSEAEFGRLRYPDPRLLAHHAPLIRLYESGKTYRQIADELGRKPHGVRGSVRKLRSVGVIA